MRGRTWLERRGIRSSGGRATTNDEDIRFCLERTFAVIFIKRRAGHKSA